MSRRGRSLAELSAASLLPDGPSAELVVLPDAGHWLPVEEAATVADVVDAFVRRTEYSGPVEASQPDGDDVSDRRVPVGAALVQQVQ